MEDKMSWLRPYTVTLVVGVVLIVLSGILVTNGPQSGSSGITGYAVYEEGSPETGVVRDISIISKDCTLTPALAVANPGDRIRLSATTYDPAGRAHRIVVKGMDVEISVRGKEVNYAEFVAKEGVFDIVDVYPCEAQGLKNARTKLVVK